MKNRGLAEVAHALDRGEKFLVMSHVGPDGDSLGSMLALADFLQNHGKTVVCANQDPVPKRYQWLPGVQQIQTPSRVEGPFDTVVLLDCSRIERVGTCATLIDDAHNMVVIDHHQEGPLEKAVHFVDTSYAATGEILAELFELTDTPISHDMALNAYVALATDTGGFRFANTTPRTLRTAADLVQVGIDVADVSNRIFNTIGIGKFRLLREVLDRSEFLFGGRVGVTRLPREAFADAEATAEDTDGLINHVRYVEGVEVALLFREVDAKTTKVSCRAQAPFDAAAFLREFGGGGHAAAAGATLAMGLEVAVTTVLERLAETFA